MILWALWQKKTEIPFSNFFSENFPRLPRLPNKKRDKATPLQTIISIMSSLTLPVVRGLLIGITGGIAAGKSTVCETLKKHGVKVAIFNIHVPHTCVS